MADRRELPGRCAPATELRESASPATNAPTIGASLAASASSANARVNASASATSVPAERECRWRNRNRPRRELRRRATAVTTRKPTRDGTITATSSDRHGAVRHDAHDDREDHEAEHVVGDGGAEHRARLDRASAPRSLNTRAVMPTLVAASAAPRNSDVFESWPSAIATA